MHKIFYEIEVEQRLNLYVEYHYFATCRVQQRLKKKKSFFKGFKEVAISGDWTQKAEGVTELNLGLLIGCVARHNMELWGRKVQHLLKGTKQGEGQTLLSRPELPNGFQGRVFNGKIWDKRCRS